MTTITLIPPRLVKAMYRKCERFFQMIADGADGRATAEDFARMCETGHRQLWVVEGEGNVLAIGLSEIVIYPRQKLCRITAVAGEDRSRWVDHLDDIENWARAQGCHTIQPVVRPGWWPALKARNYQRSHIVTERRL